MQFKTSSSRGGAETMVLQLTSGLVKRGHQVTTLLGETGWLGNKFEEFGLPWRSLSMTSWRGFLAIPGLVASIRRERPDVLLVHGARVNLFATIAAFATGVPCISVEHNMDGWRETSTFFNVIDRLIAKLNAGRIAVSEAVGDMLVEMNIMPRNKIEVIYNGIVCPDKSAALTRAEILARYSLPDNSFVVVTVARLVEQKGHRFLLESLVSLQRRFPELRCLLLGDGDLSSALCDHARSLGVADKVIFAGAVDDVMAQLPGCDLFLLPSLWEGLPVSLVEAMYMGLPVIATGVAGTPEVIENGVTGMLIQPADPDAIMEALALLIADNTLRAKLASTGMQHAHENFGIDGVLDRYEEVLARWQR